MTLVVSASQSLCAEASIATDAGMTKEDILRLTSLSACAG